MRVIGHRVSASVLALALTGGLIRSGVAQPVGHRESLTETVVSYGAQERPKPPAAKSQAVAPTVWVPGFWDLEGDPATAPRGGWVWVPGRRVPAPVAGARWVSGDWGWQNGWWSWIPGHWDTSAGRPLASVAASGSPTITGRR
jgi:hypothetical protein